MSEFPWSETFTILGVIVGFSLSQGTILIRNQRKNATLIKALINELSIVKESLIVAASNNKMPKSKLPLITEVYDANRGKLSSILTLKQLSIVQTAYAQIKQVGSPMNSGNTLFRGYIELAGGDHVIYQHDLNQELAVITEAINILRK